MGQQPQNQTMSRGDKLHNLLGTLARRQGELAPILPPDMTFDAFHATINQAFRANPSVLDATLPSLINACVKAAYDGLRVDGREAAITVDNVKISRRGQPDRFEKQARYMPMYQGLCQQLFRGGLVVAMEAHVVYEQDDYDIELTREPPIRHRPNLTVEHRGRPVLVYNIAKLASGHRSFAWMTAAEVRQVQAESRSGWDAEKKESKGVWKKWEGEQWKKTVLRRHRKTLPVGMIGHRLRDMEAIEEYPQFQPAAALAAPAGARPTRASLAHQPDDSIPLDMAFGGEGELIEAEQPREQQQTQRASAPAQQGAQAAQQAPARDEPILPGDPAEWGAWAAEIEGAIALATSTEGLIGIQREHAAILNHADTAMAERITMAFTDRAADLAGGPDDGAAAGGGQSDTAAGE